MVDRTADFSQAAKHLIRARFSFKGESPYAPDVVLVNEFCMKDFCNAALQEASRWFSSQVEMNGLKKSSRDSENTIQKNITEEDAVVLVYGAGGSVVQVEHRFVSHCGFQLASY